MLSTHLFGSFPNGVEWFDISRIKDYTVSITNIGLVANKFVRHGDFGIRNLGAAEYEMDVGRIRTGLVVDNAVPGGH